jgi:hypothetical protein
MSKVFFVTDVEATGPDFSIHNMYQFACVPICSDGTILEGVVYDVSLVSNCHDHNTMEFLKKSLGINPYTLQRRENVIPAMDAMGEFSAFVNIMLNETGMKKPIFVADNLAFDWGYIHTYSHRFLGRNPFGYAGRNIPCLSLGLYGSRDAWEDKRTHAHTHDALDDTRGNAGALSQMIKDGLVME